jgi:hypothetical protein
MENAVPRQMFANDTARMGSENGSPPNLVDEVAAIS